MKNKDTRRRKKRKSVQVKKVPVILKNAQKLAMKINPRESEKFARERIREKT